MCAYFYQAKKNKQNKNKTNPDNYGKLQIALNRKRRVPHLLSRISSLNKLCKEVS